MLVDWHMIINILMVQVTTTTEKQIIVTYLRSGMSKVQISKMLKRDNRTVKKAANKVLYKRR